MSAGGANAAIDGDQFFGHDLPELLAQAGDDEVVEVKLNGPENPVQVTLEKVGTDVRTVIAEPIVKPSRTLLEEAILQLRERHSAMSPEQRKRFEESLAEKSSEQQ